jgi:hypothetical protein
MWNVVLLLLMHLLGAADCVVASYVLVIKSSIIYITVIVVAPVLAVELCWQCRLI